MFLEIKEREFYKGVGVRRQKTMTRARNFDPKCPLSLSGCPSDDFIKIYEEREEERCSQGKESNGTSRLENEIYNCYSKCEKFRARVKRNFPSLDKVLHLKMVKQ